jgi:hypothetical protein
VRLEGLGKLKNQINSSGIENYRTDVGFIVCQVCLSVLDVNLESYKNEWHQ